jgi:hypothetical protein
VLGRRPEGHSDKEVPGPGDDWEGVIRWPRHWVSGAHDLPLSQAAARCHERQAKPDEQWVCAAGVRQNQVSRAGDAEGTGLLVLRLLVHRRPAGRLLPCLADSCVVGSVGNDSTQHRGRVVL